MSNSKYEIKTFKTVRTFMKTGSCSEATMNVVDRSLGYPMEHEEHGVMPLAGGIGQQGYQCGMLWGASLAGGAQAYRQYGTGTLGETAALTASQAVVKAFVKTNKSINCLEISETDWTKKSALIMNVLKGGPITCMRKTAQFAPVAVKEIKNTLATRPSGTPCCPGNCGSKMAKKLGLTEKQTVMAAGFAGGIGLSGGGCGALGVATWAIGMKCSERGMGYKETNQKVSAIIEDFLKNSNYEFECSEIVGREFESIDDHAHHIRGGSCDPLIDAVAQSTMEQLSELQEVKLAG